MTQLTVLTALRISISQNVHLQDKDSDMNPPIIGPTAGPVKGPRIYHPTTRVRSIALYISLIVPPPLAILALPKNPERNRKPISICILFAKAQGIFVNVNIVKPTI